MIRNGLLLLVSFAAFAVPVTAVTGETTLKEIMQELRRNFLEVSDGFLLDDFDRVAEGALAIAEP